MDAAGPRIETERLVLRLPRREDFEGYAELLGDAESSRHIGGVVSRAAAWRRFLQMPGAWLVQGFGMFSVEHRGSGEWLGQCGPWQPEGWPGTEVGWSFRRVAWGHGYATEAARASIDWAFAHLGWDRVIHCIGPENAASRAVAQRLGSYNQGPAKLPDPYADFPVDVWGQTRAEWEQRR